MLSAMQCKRNAVQGFSSAEAGAKWKFLDEGKLRKGRLFGNESTGLRFAFSHLALASKF